MTKAGLEWGNWTFNTPGRGDFRVITHNLVDGRIVSEKADNKSINEESVVDEFEVYKVFAPNVKVGSVIDITYSFVGIPFEWRFQERIPVVFNELIMEENAYLKYDKTHFGFEPIQTLSPTRWRTQNVPSFQEEPFLNNYANYITKFEFQIVSYSGTFIRYSFGSDWRSIVNKLAEFPDFGRLSKNSPYTNDFVKETEAKNLSVNERIQAAYEYVRRNMKWNGQFSLFPSRDLRERFLKTHTGTSADINLMLIAVLTKLDVIVYPIALSTRSNGLLVEFSPTVFKFNNVIAFIQEKDFEMFVDATSEFVDVPGILPAQCINSRGLLVKKENEQWFTLNRNYSDITKQYVSITVNADGTAGAKVFQDYAGYGYLKWRDELKESNNDAELQKNRLTKKYPDMSFLKYEVSKMDAKTLTGKETIDLDITNLMTDAGGAYIFNPFVMFEYQENPFKKEERKYPVDLNYPRDFSATITVQLPQGFSVPQLPESVKLTSVEGAATFTYLANSTGKMLTFRASMKINRHIFTELEYKDLRSFFSEVVKKLNTPVELSKT